MAASSGSTASTTRRSTSRVPTSSPRSSRSPRARPGRRSATCSRSRPRSPSPMGDLLPFDAGPAAEPPGELPAASGAGLAYVGPHGPMFFGQEPDASLLLHGPLRVELPADARAALDALYEDG